MAQLDAHMVRLQKTTREPRDVVQAAMENARGLLGEHRVQIDVHDNLPQVAFDFERICEVITHLLENAAKYSARDSDIRLSVESRDGEVIINVADHGSGIDSMEESLIFDKFYRGREHRLLVHGTGMGLAISKVIVEAHGGTLTVVSQPGAGSVFSIHLPVTSQT
jgi:two-component system sensor histidine kinase KdpD